MGTMPASRAAHLRRGGPVMRGGLAAIAMITLALAAGCASGSAAPPASASSSSGTAGSGNITANNASGVQGDIQGDSTAGSFTLAFAKCMRAHGVPNFPDPNGQGGQLGPGGGIDPTSAAFQAALNGPCLSLAPAGWVNSGSGPVTR